MIFTLDDNYVFPQTLVDGATRLTHTHYQAIQGAILQAWAVDLALRMEEPNQADIDTFMCTLLERMTTLEQTMSGSNSLKAKKTKTQETEGLDISKYYFQLNFNSFVMLNDI